MPTINPLRESAELLEAIAIGAVNLASQVSIESPNGAPDARTALQRANHLTERRGFLDDADKAANLAATFYMLAAGELADHPADVIAEAAADYSERLARIEGFVNGFRHVPAAVQWFETIGQPILKMAAGEKL